MRESVTAPGSASRRSEAAEGSRRFASDVRRRTKAGNFQERLRTRRHGGVA